MLETGEAHSSPLLFETLSRPLSRSLSKPLSQSMLETGEKPSGGQTNSPRCPCAHTPPSPRLQKHFADAHTCIHFPLVWLWPELEEDDGTDVLGEAGGGGGGGGKGGKNARGSKRNGGRGGGAAAASSGRLDVMPYVNHPLTHTEVEVCEIAAELLADIPKLKVMTSEPPLLPAVPLLAPLLCPHAWLVEPYLTHLRLLCAYSSQVQTHASLVETIGHMFRDWVGEGEGETEAEGEAPRRPRRRARGV